MDPYRMKKILIILLIINASIPIASPQLESGEGRLSGFKVESWYQLNIDPSILDRLRELDKPKESPFQFAFPAAVSLNPGNSGSWKEASGEKVWTVGIKSASAKSLNLILEPFRIPEGAYFYVYNPDKSAVRGPFGSENNNNQNILAVMPVPGEELILEYHIPAQAKWEGTLGVSQVAHDFLGLFETVSKDGRYGLSQPCNLDINCIEGNGYDLQKRAVCRIIISGIELCTGVLLNNTNQQNRSLLLTAQHCISDNNDASRSLFVFGYESPWCSGPDGRVSHSIAGSSLLSTNENIDFSLVELSSFPPITYKPYLAGWDVSGIIPQKTASIHHPMGDVKKISVDVDEPVTSTFTSYTSNGFWKVLKWEAGTTEGGSSGGPLFDQNKRVVGILSGGEAVCGRSVNDYFAKLSFIYDLSGVLWQQLRGWIDPAVTGLKTFNGRDPYAPNLLTIDTLSNLNTGENQIVTPYTLPGKGYSTGYNSDSLVMYAEYFSSPAGRELSEVLIDVADVNTLLSADSARIFIFSDGPVPGSVIASTRVMLREAKDAFTLSADFTNTVPLSGNFYIGWKFWYVDKAVSETRQFAVYHSPDRGGDPLLNTAWFSNGLQWKKFTQHPSYPASLSLCVKAVTIGNSTPSEIQTPKEAKKEFILFPNPAGEFLNVYSSQLHDRAELKIYDMNGVQSGSENADGIFPGHKQLDIRNLKPGIYFVLIQTSRGSEIHKILKLR
jgi:hypothetical protein